MAEPQPADLVIHRSASRSIDRLDRGTRSRFADFISKFTENMHLPGLRLKRLKGAGNCWSARVTDDYRAILCEVGPASFALIAVEPRQSSYDRIEDRYQPVINRVSGAFEVVNLEEALRAVGSTSAAVPARTVPGLFSAIDEARLVELGVPEPLLPSVRLIANEAQLDRFCECVPPLTAEVLQALQMGYTPDEVEALVSTPVKTAEPVDPNDFAAAISRPASMVTSTDAAVAAMLGNGFEAWRLWPHPTQRKLIDQTHKGPARVSGGPGTGKTVVALHRAARLARALAPDTDERLLLTTFTRNLANDLKGKLATLLDKATLHRVDVEHLDSVVYRLAAEHHPGLGNLVDDRDMLALWDEVSKDDNDFDAEFLHSEWNEVICGQLLTSRSEYFQARRTGRPRRLNRLQRARIWQFVERFDQRRSEHDAWCWPQLRAKVALAEEHRLKGAYRYRHIVVDEAQDLTTAHWRLLRALAPRTPTTCSSPAMRSSASTADRSR